MEDGAHDVELGSAQAFEARKSLEAILEIASAVQQMSASSSELVNAMEMVSAVVEENTAATEQMAVNSSKLSKVVENIASVSEENSATAEEVSAAIEEVLTQVELVSMSAASLMDMAKGLQKIVTQFTLVAEVPAQPDVDLHG